MSKLMTKVYRVLLLLAISLLFSGCGTSTVKDNTQTAIGESSTSRASTFLSSQGKFDLAESLFNKAMLTPMPERNQLLMQSLTLCSEVLDDSKIMPDLYAQSRQLCMQGINQISPQSLSIAEKNSFILLAAKNLLLNQQPTQALHLLAEDFNTDQVELWSQYHTLRAEGLYQTDHASKAVRELMLRQDLLSDPQAIEQNQFLIWKYLSSIPNDKLEQLIHNETMTQNNIFLGWLTLSKLFRQDHDIPAFDRDFSLWLQTNPAHPADVQFINKIIAARENAIFKPAQIAVLLPMKGKLAKPAKAIIDGLVASHYTRPISNNLQLRFYDSSNSQKIWDTYQKAISNGAKLIIGPLSKQSLQILSQSMSLPVPTLALNSLEHLQSPQHKIKSPQLGNKSPQLEKNSLQSASNTHTNESSLQATGSQTTNQLLNHKQAFGYQQAVQNHRTQNLFQFGLSPESDARRVADKAWKDGHFYASILIPDSDWGKRMQSAFQQRWEKLGGIVADTVVYPPTAQDFSDLIKSLLHIEQSKERRLLVSQTIGRKVEFTPRRRQDIDMVFMAAFPQQARQIPLQIIYQHGETLPVYASSHIISSYHNRKNNIDLDGVHFADMPWMLGKDNNAISLSNHYQSILFQRLFTLGVDSYRISPYLQYLSENPSESIVGESGQLSISNHGYVIRTLPWVTFSDGIIQQNQESVRE
jgi:outer membrane PBP1 activator LpoA protein